MRHSKLMLGGCLALCAGWATAGELELDWLAGRWCSNGDGRQIEEVWLAEAGATALGLSRTLRGQKLESFEYMRIVSDGKAAHFHVQPNGAPPTVFAQAGRGQGWIRFENPAHDFPNRIEYRRQGDRLHAYIAGPGSDGKEMKISFDYQRCGE
jgi:hypothetical protein